jgi:hypothetical protein
VDVTVSRPLATASITPYLLRPVELELIDRERRGV